MGSTSMILTICRMLPLLPTHTAPQHEGHRAEPALNAHLILRNLLLMTFEKGKGTWGLGAAKPEQWHMPQ